MASRYGNECSHYANKVIVHVARVAESRRAGGHDGRNLKPSELVVIRAVFGLQVDSSVEMMALERAIDLLLFLTRRHCQELPITREQTQHLQSSITHN